MKIYKIDAFTDEVFKGNPAAVIIFDQWLPAKLMQSIAIENNVSETSFARKIDSENYEIRWFSPVEEVYFCGYGTLATSFVIFRNAPHLNEITFHIEKSGKFYVKKMANGKISINLPIQYPAPVHEIPKQLHQALQQPIYEVLINPQAYIVIYPSVEAVLNEVPNYELIKTLGGRRVAITAKNDQCENWGGADIISRYFTPSMGINEDHVTGSIHTSLIPYWQPHLKKKIITAYQASKRGGFLFCKLVSDHRIEIAGYCQLYLEGEIQLTDS